MMDCNKEEALRAKEIAEKKMENKDYAGARKIATKAQNLHPDLENIAQMICVCDVHCSAETSVFGNEKDWYNILQVNPTADDGQIKKQYRKLALLLHPDKNKFAGAEAAFKLIGEAQRTLLDSQKRSFFDVRWKSLNRHMAPNRPASNPSANKIPNKQPGVGNIKSFPTHNQAQSAVPNGIGTFWTSCPFCSVRYQYYKEYLNKAITCQTCRKSFIAYDAHVQAMPPRPNQTSSELNKQNMAHGANTGRQKNPNVGSSSVGPTKGKVHGPRKTSEQSKDAKRTSEPSNDANRTSEPSNDAKRTSEPRMGEGPSNLKKTNKSTEKRQLSDSSESFDSESSTDSEVEMSARVKLRMNGGDVSRRRSSRNRRRVSYNEGGSDDDEMRSPPKKAKVDPSSKEELNEKNKLSGSDENINRSENGKVNGFTTMAGDNETESPTPDNVSTSNSDSESESPDEVQECPDPEFSDFDGVRSKECFEVGQIWAVYDTLDAMPRFYAHIRKVFSPGFKLKIAWLEADPNEGPEAAWVRKELPMACGKFKFGDTQNTDSNLMFSHPIVFEKCGGGALNIYPKKGETWALFKNWHIGWTKPSEESPEYNYDYVEVLSAYDQTAGIRVGFLGKLRGFSSLFCRKSGEESDIPPNELLRFSHRVPSFKMTGKERDDVPQGAFELDPACVALNLEEISVPPEMKVGPPDATPKGSPSEPVEEVPDVKPKGESSSSPNEGTRVNKEHESVPVDDDELKRYFPSIDEHGTPEHDTPEHGTPEPEFFDFEGAKDLDKLQIDQIWALYSDTDGMPKYYAVIKKINLNSDTKVEIVWLDWVPLADDLIQWKDEDVPAACGRFILKKRRREPYENLAAFSHQVIPTATLTKTTFEIHPRKGEIWAVYKNWNVEMSAAELLCCEYDVVEIQQEKTLNRSSIRVSYLERVPSYKTVFNTRMDGSSSVTTEIPYKELLKFSHQIPSYRLTDEKGGSLRGCWELDPNALPASFFS